jgi:hypothetical protein
MPPYEDLMLFEPMVVACNLFTSLSTSRYVDRRVVESSIKGMV